MSALKRGNIEGYKQTEVGVIPEDWDIYPLDKLITSTQLGGNYANSETESNYPLIKMGNLGRGKIKLDKLEFVKGNVSVRDRLELNDVLFNTRNTLELVGKVAIWKNELPEAYFNSNLMRFVFDEKLVSSNSYMNAAMNTKTFVTGLAGIATGTTSVAAIYTRDLLQLKLPIPPKREQTVIANALSDVDALLTELENLIAKKQAIKTATMQQLLTGKTRLPQFATYTEGEKKGQPKGTKPSELGEIPEDWGKVNIGDNAILKARIGWQALTTKEYLYTGSKFLVTGTDFDAGNVNWDSCCFVSDWRYKQDANIQLKTNDVLITKDGTIGKVGFINDLPLPATLNSGVFVIRPKLQSFHPKYLFYVLTSSVFKSFMKGITAGSTITHLYQKDFVNFEFSSPGVEEQTAIAAILSDMDCEIQTLEQRLAKNRQIKQGMMQELLTGRTRLPFKKDS
ncbi:MULTISPECIES: restriction endonuclease subunit S [unclassified Vibrio]|uniref:restriction endonuclease subunit S n=1 Tax=unclassified Vibrio TaxID=2614977 RepID=UPI00355287DF